MEIIKQLEAVEVNIEDGKATITFIDQERGEIHDVSISTKKYNEDTGKFEGNQEQADKAEAKAQRLFGLSFDKLGQVIGERHDIYVYDRFDSLEEVTVVAKFDKDMVGQIIQVDVASVEADEVGLHIKFEYEGETYQSNQNYATYMESTGTWFQNAQKRKKQEAKFESKFGITVENKEELVGKAIMAEVKDFNGNVWIEIKAFPKKKK